MFPPNTNHDEESKASYFTALSLSTGVQGAQQSHFLSHGANKKQPASLAVAYSRSREGPCESQESMAKIKRPRSLDGSALTIGTGSSSSQLKLNGVDHPIKPLKCGGSGARNGEHAGEYFINKPHQVVSMSAVSNASEVRAAAHTASAHFEFINGINSKNSNKMRAYERAGLRSGSEVNDVNKGWKYHQSAIGFSNGSGKKMSGYRRTGATVASSSAAEKIHRRMIKNRESAARSRARKQALEAQQQAENMELKKENDILKRVVRFLLAILRTKHMKPPAMSRSYSAPL